MCFRNKNLEITRLHTKCSLTRTRTLTPKIFRSFDLLRPVLIMILSSACHHSCSANTKVSFELFWMTLMFACIGSTRAWWRAYIIAFVCAGEISGAEGGSWRRGEASCTGCEVHLSVPGTCGSHPHFYCNWVPASRDETNCLRICINADAPWVSESGAVIPATALHMSICIMF